MRRVWDGVGAGQSGLSVVCARWVGRSAPMFNFPVRSEPGGKIPPRMGMADGSCADSYPLPSDASHQSGFVLGMFGTFGACRASAAAVPVWRGKAGPCEMSRASLPANPPGTDQGGDATCGAAHVLAASGAGAAASAQRLSSGVIAASRWVITSCSSCRTTPRAGIFLLRPVVGL